MRGTFVLAALLAAALTLPGAAIGAPGDIDNDTVPDATDNCVSVYNIEQGDFDADGIGNVCDPTPGVLGDRTQYYVYFRDVLTGGPLPACATFRLTTSEGLDATGCARRILLGALLETSFFTMELLSAPAGCTALWDRLTFGPPASSQLGTVQTFNLWFVCGATVEAGLEELQADVVGVGSGQSLARKIESALASYQAGDVAAACETLTGFVNEVEAQRGKKISEATAADLLARANTILQAIC